MPDAKLQIRDVSSGEELEPIDKGDLVEKLDELLPGLAGSYMPHEGAALIRDLLREIFREPGASFDPSGIARPLRTDAIFQVVMSFLEDQELIEYGTTIRYPWLTERGEQLLGLLEALTAEDGSIDWPTLG